MRFPTSPFRLGSVADWPLRDQFAWKTGESHLGADYSVRAVARQANPNDEILFSWTLSTTNIGTMSFTRVIWCSKILETWNRRLKYLLGRSKTQASRLTELLSIWAIPAQSLNEMNEDSVSASPIPRLSSVSLGSWLFLPWNFRRRMSAIQLLKSRPYTKEQQLLKVKHRKR